MSIASGSTPIMTDKNNVLIDSSGRPIQIDDLSGPQLRLLSSALFNSGSNETTVTNEADDDRTSFCTARSRLSFRSSFSRTTRSSLYTFSTGRQSQNGATWHQELVRTMDSGFGRGAPAGIRFVGDREGRERGGYLPPDRGVGRLGKAPIAVPVGLARAALGVVEEHEEEKDLFLEAAVAELQRMMDWGSELRDKLDLTVALEFARPGTSVVPKAWFVGINVIKISMLEDQILFWESIPPIEPSSEFCREYEAVELHRRLTLGCIQLGLQLEYPERFTERSTEDNAGSVGPHTPISHSFGMVVFSAEGCLKNLKQPRPVRPPSYPGLTYLDHSAEDFPTDEEWRQRYISNLDTLLQHLRKITTMMAALSPRIIKEHRAEMKSREEKLLLLQTNLKEFVAKREYTSIYQCYRGIKVPEEKEGVEEQENWAPSTGDKECLESLGERSPSRPNSLHSVAPSVLLDGDFEDGDWENPWGWDTE